MSLENDPCGCGGTNLPQDPPGQDPVGCTRTVSKKVCVAADVTITPNVTLVQDDVTVTCQGNPMVGPCPNTVPGQLSCVQTFSQNLCVNIPLTFGADVTAMESGVACGAASPVPCQTTTGCTRSSGFFATHFEDVTLPLIEAAGGMIVLGSVDSEGNPIGDSLVVTAANALQVLTFNASMGVRFQLYRQLLAARLNLLLGVTCPFAEENIAAANLALTNQDTALYETLKDNLEAFVTGQAPGCPQDCSAG